MKILALEKEVAGVDWSKQNEILKQEAFHVYELQKQGIIREIYFNQNHCAVIILECINATTARNILNELPLVKNELIDFEVMELTPYNGYDRIIEKQILQ
jgi:hypothetical protein